MTSLPDPEWSRKETDYLLDLCELFRLRFIHIADRYQVCGLWLLSCRSLKCNPCSLRNVILLDVDWSRKETDYLLDLCELCRLHFIHIAVRYGVRQ